MDLIRNQCVSTSIKKMNIYTKDAQLDQAEVISHSSLSTSSCTLALLPKFLGCRFKNAPTAPRYPSWRKK